MRGASFHIVTHKLVETSNKYSVYLVTWKQWRNKKTHALTVTVIAFLISFKYIHFSDYPLSALSLFSVALISCMLTEPESLGEEITLFTVRPHCDISLYLFRISVSKLLELFIFASTWWQYPLSVILLFCLDTISIVSEDNEYLWGGGGAANRWFSQNTSSPQCHHWFFINGNDTWSTIILLILSPLTVSLAIAFSWSRTSYGTFPMRVMCLSGQLTLIHQCSQFHCSSSLSWK